MTRSARSLFAIAAATAAVATPLVTVPAPALADAGAPVYEYQDAWYKPLAQASDAASDPTMISGGVLTNASAARAVDLSWVDVGVSSIPGRDDKTHKPGRFVYVDIASHDNRAAMTAPFVDYSVSFSWTTQQTVKVNGKPVTKTIPHKSVFGYHGNDYYPQGYDIWRTSTRDGKATTCPRSWSFETADYSKKGAVSRFAIPASCVGAQKFVVAAQARVRATNAHTPADAYDTAGPVVVDLSSSTLWNSYRALPEAATPGPSVPLYVRSGQVSVGKARTTATSTYNVAPTFQQGRQSYLATFTDGADPDRIWWFSVTTDAAGANPSFYTYDSASSSFRWSCAERDADFTIQGTKATLSIPNECFASSDWVTAKVPGIRYASPAVPLP